MNRAIVPSGWTPAGLIEHLGDAERVWFQNVIADESTDEPGAPTRTVAEALAYYRACVARSDDILGVTPLDAQPAARPMVDIGIPYEVRTVRDVVLHLIEETARHAGHLDIARELIDGRIGLGPR